MSRKGPSGDKLLYGFSLNERVPEYHLLLRVRKGIDYGGIWQLAEPGYRSTRAPSVDPAAVLRIALLGYLYGITSERRPGHTSGCSLLPANRSLDTLLVLASVPGFVDMLEFRNRLPSTVANIRPVQRFPGGQVGELPDRLRRRGKWL